MITKSPIKYQIQPIEFNEDISCDHWRSQDCTAWFGLSELASVPSLFIQIEDMELAISVNDLEEILSTDDIVRRENNLSKTTQG